MNTNGNSYLEAQCLLQDLLEQFLTQLNANLKYSELTTNNRNLIHVGMKHLTSNFYLTFVYTYTSVYLLATKLAR